MSTPVLDRLESRAARTPLRVRGRNPAMLGLRVARRCSRIRVTGLAAEICYYLVLSILPLVIALGTGLAFVGNVVDAEDVEQMEAVLIRAVEAVLSPQLTAEIAVPLLQELLRSQPVGAAAGSVALALFLGSRVFQWPCRSPRYCTGSTLSRRCWARASPRKSPKLGFEYRSKNRRHG